MTTAKAFLAGFLSTLVFHQGARAILHGAGATARLRSGTAGDYFEA
jgi:hypothetical protein